MSNEISKEQKAHDLAVAYASFLATTYENAPTAEIFYQDYENAFLALLPVVKHHNK